MISPKFMSPYGTSEASKVPFTKQQPSSFLNNSYLEECEQFWYYLRYNIYLIGYVYC